jgi:hypothetical protein
MNLSLKQLSTTSMDCTAIQLTNTSNTLNFFQTTLTKLS